jgi:hypothetical protein
MKPEHLLREALLRYATGLRFPRLLAVTAGIWVLDLLVPDALPLVDEILLGLTSLMLASLRREARDRAAGGQRPPDPHQRT